MQRSRHRRRPSRNVLAPRRAMMRAVRLSPSSSPPDCSSPRPPPPRPRRPTSAPPRRRLADAAKRLIATADGLEDDAVWLDTCEALDKEPPARRRSARRTTWTGSPAVLTSTGCGRRSGVPHRDRERADRRHGPEVRPGRPCAGSPARLDTASHPASRTRAPPTRRTQRPATPPARRARRGRSSSAWRTSTRAHRAQDPRRRRTGCASSGSSRTDAGRSGGWPTDQRAAS